MHESIKESCNVMLIIYVVLDSIDPIVISDRKSGGLVFVASKESPYRMLASCVLLCNGSAYHYIDVYNERGPKLCTGESGVINDAVHAKHKSTTLIEAPAQVDT